jgi:hypothetical protein
MLGNTINLVAGNNDFEIVPDGKWNLQIHGTWAGADVDLLTTVALNPVAGDYVLAINPITDLALENITANTNIFVVYGGASFRAVLSNAVGGTALKISITKAE